MSTVDSKVVEARFDNKGFAAGIKSTIQGLSNLTSALAKASGNVALDGLGKSADRVTQRFSIMRVAAVTAVATIASQATRAAERFVKGFTLDPITDGFKNYETQINAVQTILANTGLEGKKGLGQVNDVLADLNKYANQTVYNFSDMTKNIGTFTAAGVALQPAANAIKGIANLAALSGSSSDQASTAMYQLSQAIAANKVGLQDWNSVVNAGLGGKVFQRALFQTGATMKTIKGLKVGETFDQWTKAGNSFRGSLQKGWITGDVLTKTLSQFTGDMTDAQLAAQGFNKTEILSIQKLAKTAQGAATNIKTVSQLKDALKEEVGTAYAAIFKTLLGDINQATSLLSTLHVAIENALTGPIYKVNKLLQDWAKLGGRVRFIDAIKYAFKDLMSVIKPIQQAFRHIFPAESAKNLYELTNRVEKFFQFFKLGKGAADNLRRTFQGLFAILDIGKTVFEAAAKFIGHMFAAITSGSKKGGFLAITGQIGDFLVHLDHAIKKGHGLTDFFSGLEKILAGPIKVFHQITAVIAELFGGQATKGGNALEAKFTWLQGVPDKISAAWFKLKGVYQQAVAWLGEFASKFEKQGASLGQNGGGILGVLKDLFKNFDASGISSAFDKVGGAFGKLGKRMSDGFKNIDFSKIGSFLKSTVTAIGHVLASAVHGIGTFFSHIDFSQVLSAVNTGLFAALVLMLKKFTGGLKGAKPSMGIVDSIKETLEGVTGTLKNMQKTLKAAILLEIAIALGILAAACVALAAINSEALQKALSAMGQMMAELFASLYGFSKIGGVTGIVATATGMVIFAGAIGILTGAVKALAKVPMKELKQGLEALGALIAEVVVASAALGKSAPLTIAGSAGMIILAGAIKILVGVVKDLGKQDFKVLQKGLISVGALLGGLALFTQLQDANAGGIAAAGGLVLLALAIKELAKSVKTFGETPVKVLRQGLIAIGLILAGFAAFSQGVGNPASTLAAAAAMVVISYALQQLVPPLQAFGQMSWKEIAKGLVTMGGALGIIAASTTLMDGALPGAAAIVIVASSLATITTAMQNMGQLSWEEIAKGLVTLAGALTIIAVAMDAMTFAVFGAAALVLVAAALKLFIPELILLSQLTWTQIAIGLVALAGALAVIGIAAALLTPVIPSLLGLGAAIALLGIGVAGIGAGIFLVATGLVAISAAGAGAALAITVIATAIVKLIPLLASELVKGLDVLVQALAQMLPHLLSLVKKVLLDLINVVASVAPPLISTLVKILSQLLSTLSAHAPTFAKQIVNIVVSMVEAIKARAPELVNALLDIIGAMLKGIRDHVGDFVNTAKDIIVNLLNGLKSGLPQIVAAAVSLIIAFVDGLAGEALRLVNAALDLVVTLINGIADAIRTHTQPLIDAGENLGSAIVDGIVKGLKDVGGKVVGAAKNMAKSALSSAADFLDINSPSKKFIKLGHSVGEGFEQGITEGSPGVKAAWQQASGLLTQAVQDSRSQIQAYQSDIAKASDAYKSSGDKVTYYSNKIKEASGNHKTSAATLAKLNEQLAAAKKNHQDAADKVAHYTKLLKDATENHKLSKAALEKLNAEHTVENEQLTKLATAYDAYNKQLDDAKQKLVDLKQVRDDYNKSVTDEFTTLPTVDTNTTASSYNTSLQEQLADLNKFIDVLGQLRGLGLDDQTYKLLITAGTQALPFMEDLLSQTQNGGPNNIAAIDALDAQISGAAASLGAQASTTLYQAGVDAQQAVVDGLTQNLKDLHDKMDVIADAIVKGITDALHGKSSQVDAAGAGIGASLLAGLKKALGIHSPSKEMAILGGYAADGIVIGLSNSAQNVGDAAGNLGQTAKDALKKSISGLSESFSGITNLNPTITPVLDLTSVKKTAGDLNGLLSTNPVGVDSSYLKAQTAGAGYQANKAAADAAAAAVVANAPAGDVFNFTQNNTSPKALSNAEIYRQTKNQISVTRGALTRNAAQVP